MVVSIGAVPFESPGPFVFLDFQRPASPTWLAGNFRENCRARSAVLSPLLLFEHFALTRPSSRSQMQFLGEHIAISPRTANAVFQRA
jgi:hypothetical protein